MAGAEGQYVSDVAGIHRLEDKLAATLIKTADEVAHSECFDAEQRAEVYTILEALKANTETHRAMAKQLAVKLKQKQGDA